MVSPLKGRLTTDPEKVRQIVVYLEDGKTHRQIHRLTGVSTVTISNIRTKYSIPIKKGKSLDYVKYRANVGNNKRYKEIEGALVYMASKMVRQNEDIWELINAVWVQGIVQTCPQKALFKCIAWGIGGYRREVNGTRNKKRAKIKQAMSLELLVSEYRDEPFLPPVIPVYFISVDSKDYFSVLSKNLTRTQKLILKLKFFEDMSQNEMAKAIGCSQTCVHKDLKKALLHIREHV